MLVVMVVHVGHHKKKDNHDRPNHETISFIGIMATRDKPRWSIHTATGNIIPRIVLGVFVIGGIVHSWLLLLLVLGHGGWWL